MDIQRREGKGLRCERTFPKTLTVTSDESPSCRRVLSTGSAKTACSTTREFIDLFFFSTYNRIFNPFSRRHTYTHTLCMDNTLQLSRHLKTTPCPRFSSPHVQLAGGWARQGWMFFRSSTVIVYSRLRISEDIIPPCQRALVRPNSQWARTQADRRVGKNRGCYLSSGIWGARLSSNQFLDIQGCPTLLHPSSPGPPIMPRRGPGSELC